MRCESSLPCYTRSSLAVMTVIAVQLDQADIQRQTSQYAPILQLNTHNLTHLIVNLNDGILDVNFLWLVNTHHIRLLDPFILLVNCHI